MIAGGDLVNRENEMSKVLGIGTVTPKGIVTAIKRDGVVIVDNKVKVVLTFAQVEQMMGV
jgi:mannitol/fructose-specific phosphotransferase system IIA component